MFRIYLKFVLIVKQTQLEFISRVIFFVNYCMSKECAWSKNKNRKVSIDNIGCKTNVDTWRIDGKPGDINQIYNKISRTPSLVLTKNFNRNQKSFLHEWTLNVIFFCPNWTDFFGRTNFWNMLFVVLAFRQRVRRLQFAVHPLRNFFSLAQKRNIKLFILYVSN